MEESTYFDSQFLRFQLMVSYCMTLGPVRRQHITVGTAVEECVTSWLPGSKEEREKEPGSQDPFQGHSPSDLTSSR